MVRLDPFRLTGLHCKKTAGLSLLALGILLLGACQPANLQQVWHKAGAAQTEISLATDQCRKETGWDYSSIIGPGAGGRAGTGGPGQPDPSLFTEEQAKKSPSAVARYRQSLFFKCMEGKGYRLEPDIPR